MKICFKCNKEKALNKFYKHKKMLDGHLNKCISCALNDEHLRRESKIDQIREYDRNRPNVVERNERFKKAQKIRMQEPKYREKIRKQKKKWLDNNIVKRASHIITGNAIRGKKLLRQPCKICADIIVEAHHEDYTKPLEITWLCKKHHGLRHKKLREIIRE